MRLHLRIACLASVFAAAATAQFSSGSTGADGALNYSTPGTYDFDPAALGLDASGDNVFNFTTINIAAGVTVNLRSSKVRGQPAAPGPAIYRPSLDREASMAAWARLTSPGQRQAQPGASARAQPLRLLQPPLLTRVRARHTPAQDRQMPALTLPRREQYTAMPA